MLAYRKKTAGAALAAVLLVGGATTACEDGKKADGGKAAAGAPSAQASASPSASGKAAGGAADATPAAYLQKAKKQSEEITSLRYTMSGTSAGQPVSGEASMRLKPSVAMAMKISSQGADAGTVEIRLIDGAMFMGAEGKWLKYDIKSLDPQSAKKLEGAGGGANNSGENPGDRADQLMGAKDLKTVGDETIDGVKTTHVTGTVTMEQMRASLATATPEAKVRQEKSLQKMEGEGIKSMNMDMWIDESGHTKQFRTRAEATKGPLDMTVKFLDYNKPVDIAAPPADQVMDLAEMMKGSGSGSAQG
ncbi:LppX_LprAFG lipoprotein [Streptomyces sp. NBC_00091]|uniref:LppX_LprAFG lipoprotein n=1 Tax=Streptomyces sp. NBC_00091 TaxID=2975648 RepID=UPI00225C419D|nr:LppX_LprAFG lipoprotein [Streptomyces sp. NBC_00091]MCX5376518.1 LppX_LprAFG lipoprotein [Streptomyces sp. NBC_00091]